MKIVGQAECPECFWRGVHFTVSYDGKTLDDEALEIMESSLALHTKQSHRKEVGA